MLQKKYKSELISIKNPIKDIYTLELKSLGRPFKYHPGQFLHLAIDNDYDGIGQWPDSRCFSMQSNPSEENIRITYALKGGFTQHMKQTLRVGSMVWLKLPYGDLFQQAHNKENTVFIAGGTGITPFLSLFLDISFCKYKVPLLYAGFRNEQFNLYENELKEAQKNNNEFVFKIVYENMQGNLNIHEILKENKQSSFFISGPPLMIKLFKQELIEKGVEANQVLTDNWE